MLVYDITSEKSFANIKNWIRNIEDVSVDNLCLPLLLVKLLSRSVTIIGLSFDTGCHADDWHYWATTSC